MKKNNEQSRLTSLDVLRGFDMFFIMGGSTIIISLATIFPDLFEGLATQMHHKPWNGFAFYDMIFPLFLFISGISFPFSLSKKRQGGVSDRELGMTIVRRGLTLVLFGMIYNGLLRFDFENMRYASVLGRIGLAWMFAAFLYMKLPIKYVIAFIVVSLGFYYGVTAFVAAPDVEGALPLTMEGWFGAYIDRMLLPGKLNNGIHDPEGVFSLLPAISTALLGMIAGKIVQSSDSKPMQKVYRLLAWGGGLFFLGWLWSAFYPLNKNMWSSSFVLYVGGLSYLLFALFYFIIDVNGYSRWGFFFKVIGMNSITIYMGQKMIAFGTTSNFLLGGLIRLTPEPYQALLSNSAYVLISWLFLYFLYKQRLFLKV